MSGAQLRANEVQKKIEPARQPGRELIRQQEQGPVQAVAPQVAYRRVQFNRNGPRPADLLALQRTVGNRGVQRMVASHVDTANDEQQGETTEESSESTVQTKLSVGAPKDFYEQGADRVARQVMTVPDAATRRPNQTGLPDGLKSGIESLSGMSMDNVNVHYNSSQPAQLNALAYTQGSDIHVAPGQEQHLPHEAWHLVQQAQGRVLPTMQMKDGAPVNDDAGLEHEADVMGTKAVTDAANVPYRAEGKAQVLEQDASGRALSVEPGYESRQLAAFAHDGAVVPRQRMSTKVPMGHALTRLPYGKSKENDKLYSIFHESREVPHMHATEVSYYPTRNGKEVKIKFRQIHYSGELGTFWWTDTDGDNNWHASWANGNDREERAPQDPIDRAQAFVAQFGGTLHEPENDGDGE